MVAPNDMNSELQPAPEIAQQDSDEVRARAGVAAYSLVSHIFLDQIDADKAAYEYLIPKVRSAMSETPMAELRSAAHETDGRTWTLWVDGKIIALAVVERDEFNRSVLVCCG